MLAIVSLTSNDAIALGTLSGIVKRVTPGDWPNKPDFELIGLKPGDHVVGAAQTTDDAELVFVASDAQLLRFPASAVRPQGRPAGGMAGINLGAKAKVISFSAVESIDDVIVATVATSSLTLAGTDAGSAKVSDFTEFPPKGRATGGVRAQRFLKGEDQLSVAWVGTSPAHAIGVDGSPRVLPESGAKRDASGQVVDGPIGFIAGAIAPPVAVTPPVE